MQNTGTASIISQRFQPSKDTETVKTPETIWGESRFTLICTWTIRFYDQQIMPTWHEGSILRDAIWLKVNGGHSKNSARLVLQISNKSATVEFSAGG